MSKGTYQKTTMDFIMYRLDSIEKRLDFVEKHMQSRNTSESPDVIRLLLDLIKNGKNDDTATLSTNVNVSNVEPNPVVIESITKCIDTAIVANTVKAVNTVNAVNAVNAVSTSPTSTLFNYENLASLTRRRTVV